MCQLSEYGAVASLCLEAEDSACFGVSVLDDFEDRTHSSVDITVIHCLSISR